MNKNPWDLFDDGPPLETADAEIARMRSVLALLRKTDEGSRGERAELYAAAQCRLAGHGVVPLAVAANAVADAESLGRVGWPGYYLAEAAVRAKSYSVALERLARIPKNFFEGRDLFWRAVRCREIEAIARAAIGDWAGVQKLVDEIAAAHATRRDSDDLAPLNELVETLLTYLPTSAPLLATIAATPQIEKELNADVLARLREALDDDARSRD